MSNKEIIITEEMEINAAILDELISLRKNRKNSKKDELLYNRAFNKAIDKFSYIVSINCNKYKKYPNFEDLKQEGMLGLICALNRFDPSRSKNFFKFATWYIKTRIKRSANKFDVINLPMNIAKEKPITRLPLSESLFGTAVTRQDPYQKLEKFQIVENIKEAMVCLNDLQKNIVCKYYGIDYNKDSITEKQSVNSIAKQMGLTRVAVEKILQECYNLMLENKKIMEMVP